MRTYTNSSDHSPGYCHKSIYANGVMTYEETPRDEDGFSDGLAGSDEFAMLQEAAIQNETGMWQGLFTYPGCGSILFERGWVTSKGEVTDAGYTALQRRHNRTKANE